MSVHDVTPPSRLPEPSAVLELLKPLTWFAPMWAFGCGVVSSGAPVLERWPMVLGGLLLAGPLVCAMSQATNDWHDRHVDAINEPNRPIPSGRIPGTWGFRIAVIWGMAAVAMGAVLGPWVLAAALLAIACAIAYSAPPLRLKRNGWWSCLVCGLCYESLPWITGAAVMREAAPDPRILAVALLYGLGAHGIMTLNDFKAIEGDARLGLRSLPVQLGPARAAQIACVTMALPQMIVVGLLLAWGLPWHGGIVAVLVAAQIALMPRLLADPEGRAPWYNATGTGLYVLGMLTSALALSTVMSEILP
ncbi:MAG: chlorophyll synthase ChlG [Pseudomonadota bacterium]